MSDTSTPYPDLDVAQEITWGRSAAVVGILAMVLCMLGACTCYTSVLVALPAAGIAMYLARNARVSTDGEARAYANVGLVSGLISLLYALMWVTFLALYLGLYVVLILVMVVSGSF